MDLDEVVAAIDSGDLDGNIDAIATACVNRLREGAIEMAWRLRYDGDEWTQQTVTLGELKFAESTAQVVDYDENRRPYRRKATMWELNPNGNAEHAVALLVAHFHKAQGVPLADAVKRAESITAAELKDVIGEFEVVNGPKDDGTSEPPTDVSPTV